MKFKFTIATKYVRSQYSEIVDLDDDLTASEIEDAYNEWLLENNEGYYERALEEEIDFDE